MIHSSKIRFIDEKTQLDIYDSFVINCSPEDIYTAIKKMSNYSNKYIMKCFLELECKNVEYQYYVDIFMLHDNIKIKAYKNDEYRTVIYYEKNVAKTKQNDNVLGNCVDDFIRRGIETQIDTINDLIKDIKSRKELRSNLLEYHSSSCYEHDFRQIINIKDMAQKIINNCNKHLERSADKYTKINY